MKVYLIWKTVSRRCSFLVLHVRTVSCRSTQVFEKASCFMNQDIWSYIFYTEAWFSEFSKRLFITRPLTLEHTLPGSWETVWVSDGLLGSSFITLSVRSFPECCETLLSLLPTSWMMELLWLFLKDKSLSLPLCFQHDIAKVFTLVTEVVNCVMPSIQRCQLLLSLWHFLKIQHTGKKSLVTVMQQDVGLRL